MGADREAIPPLPVRTGRFRRAGRHSSPHQLSLPSDAPALVIAVPGVASPAAREIAEQVAAVAGASCSGAEVRVGYLQGHQDRLSTVLESLAGATHPAVVVPLVAFAHVGIDAAIAAVIDGSPTPCLTSAPLGPHPLLAEALHVRLAEAGLARATRVGRVNVVSGAEGVIVGADEGNDTVPSAGVVAVLLASRLTVPVACAPLTDPAKVMQAAQELRNSGVGRVALAPCVIGPELGPRGLEFLADPTGLPYADVLGAYHAIAQLVAIRYGAALVDPQLADLASGGRGTRAAHAGPPRPENRPSTPAMPSAAGDDPHALPRRSVPTPDGQPLPRRGPGSAGDDTLPRRVVGAGDGQALPKRVTGTPDVEPLPKRRVGAPTHSGPPNRSGG